MKSGVASFVAWCAMVMVVALVAAETAAAANCNPMELSPCLGAMMGTDNPSAVCCQKLKEQVPCFCNYLKNPTLRQFIDSPNAKKVAAVCGLQQPSC
ncbi:hypothetical protein ABFS82_12G029100 [Erythranthe guttata]|nr:PREDICTED: non-specific lipid-transfer protein 2-like [Erythranthe guttata]|eukprot:XP_012832523.1 PREDICTED: non-specific lipid-transfer protein 2-like [Erythranthe guttata]